MKYVFHVSPNIKGRLTTHNIMRDLMIALAAVFVCSLVYYGSAYGMATALHDVVLLAASLVTTYVCEFLYAKATKQEPKTFIKNSFGCVTALILTMMCTVNVTVYAIIIATVFAIVFGRLLFGGFGQNIFNPAAVGRAVIFAAFTGASTDLLTSATPVSEIATSYHWLPANAEMVDTFVDGFGGWTSMLLGTHGGAIGETFILAILIAGAFLIWRHVIDWRIPTVYFGVRAVLTALIAILTGLESYNGIPAWLWYPAIHLLTGGVVFGGVFMLTDPVTNPTSPAGRVIFATGAAVLTVLIRLKANLPEGCLYSILLMNMFTPMIEQALDGKQLQMVNKARIIAGVLLVLGLASCFYVSATVEPVASLKSSATSAATTAATGEGESGDEEHASTEATAGGEGEGDAEHASTEATEGTEDAE